MKTPVPATDLATAKANFEAMMLGDIGVVHDKVDELKVKLDGLGGSINDKMQALPNAADREMKRAGAEAISALSNQVGRLAQQVAGDAAANERQKSFTWAAGAMGVVATATYVAGVGLGSMAAGGAGWGILSGLALLAGFVIGVAVNKVFFPEKIIEQDSTKKEPPAKPWQKSEFDVVCSKVHALSGQFGLPKPISHAVWEVLSKQATLSVAASTHNVQKNDLLDAIEIAEKNR